MNIAVSFGRVLCRFLRRNKMSHSRGEMSV